MRNLLARKPDAVVWLIAGYFCIQFIVRLLQPHGLRFDESQQAFVSQWLTLGYDSQPPLYNWLQSIVVWFFGLSLATVSATKNLVLFLVYLTYYKLAREVLEDKLYAVIATLSLLTIPQLFWEAQRDLTHTVIQLLTINLFLYGVIKTLKAPSLGSYAFMGLALGLGMLSKYNFTLVAVAAMPAVWLHPQGRARIMDRRFLLSIALAVLIFLPHGLWLLHNLDIASGRTLGIMKQEAPDTAFAKLVQGPFKFLRLVLVIMAPTVLVYTLVFGRSFWKSLRASSEWTRFFTALFVTIALLVLVLVVTIGMTSLRDRWLLPFLFLMPIYFCLKMQAAGHRSDSHFRRFIVVPLVLMILIPTALLARPNLPTLFGRYEAYNVPYSGFAKHIAAEESKTPGLIVTDSWLPAGNLHLQWPDVPLMSRFFDNMKIAYEWTADRPILMVWITKDSGEALPPLLAEWVTQNLGEQYSAVDVKSTSVPYHRGRAEDQVGFSYVWIYPK
ncbi:glycosyltransferase family 39 protein [Rhizobium sp.]|uniref:glycosyltransferase family 39 protein n=1 Tax=Rhizobium sp. TaxID=391 RepID=UPI000DBA8862